MSPDCVEASGPLATFPLCKFTGRCWRGDAVRYRHSSSDPTTELARLRRTTGPAVPSPGISASPSLDGFGDDSEDDERMEQIEAMSCRSCGFLHWDGCSSQCEASKEREDG